MNAINAESIELEKTYEKMTDNELIEVLSEPKDDFDNDVYELVVNEARKRGISIDSVEDAKKEKDERKSYSSLAKRVISTLIDFIIVSTIIWFLIEEYTAGVEYYIFSPHYFASFSIGMRYLIVQVIISFFFSFLLLLYGTFFVGKFGKTPGQALVKIRILTQGKLRVTYRTAFMRALSFLMYTILPIGGILMLISGSMIMKKDKRQAIHDKLCKTIVVNNMA